MILTFKQKHGEDFSREWAQAKQVADFAVKHRVISSKYVSHFGLKSEISNQILRKYSRNKRCKGLKSVNLFSKEVSHFGWKCCHFSPDNPQVFSE